MSGGQPLIRVSDQKILDVVELPIVKQANKSCSCLVWVVLLIPFISLDDNRQTVLTLSSAVVLTDA